jgi:hypothetical protein
MKANSIGAAQIVFAQRMAERRVPKKDGYP